MSKKRSALFVALSTLLLYFIIYTYHFWSKLLHSARISTLAESDVGRHRSSYFAICAIVKNEDNLAEWVEYHHRLGCDKFYIYDNNNSTFTAKMQASVESYIESSIVDYHVLTEGDIQGFVGSIQLHVYNEKCIKEHSKRHSFMGFIDSDEFIVLPVADNLKHRDNAANTTVNSLRGGVNSITTRNGVPDPPMKTIPRVLKQFESYGGVTLNWMMFGSSGHIRRPSNGVIAHYTKCFISVPVHVKTIVNTRHVLSTDGNPHAFLYNDGKHAVDTRFSPVRGPFNPPHTPPPPMVKITPVKTAHTAGDSINRTTNSSSIDTDTAVIAEAVKRRKEEYETSVRKLSLPLYDTMYINHYHTRSLEDFRDKMARGRFNNRNFSMEYFESFDKSAVNDCPVLQMPPPRV